MSEKAPESLPERPDSQAVPVPVDAASAPKTPAKIHLGFLDGLRGASAFYVVLCHVYLGLRFAGATDGLSHATQLLTNWLVFGTISVTIFITLSGYCLMIPLVRRGTTAFAKGNWDFIQRRAIRILPPYYASVILTLLAIAVVPTLHDPMQVQWRMVLPAFKADVILSHLLLVQNLSPHWLFNINYTMWSVATEWQIYFFFAFLLLPAMKRWGIYVAVILAFVVGFAFDRFFHGAHFDYLGIFALGMFGAAVTFSPPGSRDKRLEQSVPWGIIALVLFLVNAYVNRNGDEWFKGHSTQCDIMFGVVAVSFIIECARQAGATITFADRIRRVIVGFLETRAMAKLGAFSYSLYLTHAPVVAVVTPLILALGLPREQTFWLTMVVVPICCLVVAYPFFLAFEKPAIDYRAKR